MKAFSRPTRRPQWPAPRAAKLAHAARPSTSPLLGDQWPSFRELAAAMTLQALLQSDPEGRYSREDAAIDAVEFADALLHRLHLTECRLPPKPASDNP